LGRDRPPLPPNPGGGRGWRSRVGRGRVEVRGGGASCVAGGALVCVGWGTMVGGRGAWMGRQGGEFGGIVPRWPRSPRWPRGGQGRAAVLPGREPRWPRSPKMATLGRPVSGVIPPRWPRWSRWGRTPPGSVQRCGGGCRRGRGAWRGGGFGEPFRGGRRTGYARGDGGGGEGRHAGMARTL
jgi:hypothetical protein